MFTLNACLATGEGDGVEAAIIVAAQSKALLDVKHIIGRLTGPTAPMLDGYAGRIASI
ncbi:hypothetical protein [Chloroflexus sp.]|uniref:hypothetical protein n=1 Tax=Chloroflexus sp. TaxID=1904827 RepID=UPI002ACDC460|nr:hypothetical protein [Chloroflexus sp.]